MDEDPAEGRCKVSTCTLYENDTWKTIFKPFIYIKIIIPDLNVLIY